MPYVTIDSPAMRAETTVINYISNSLSSFYTNSINFYRGMDNQDKIAPAVIVDCMSAEETYYQTRVYAFNIDVHVRDIAYDTTTASFCDLGGQIFSLFGDSRTSSAAMNVSNSNMNIYQTQITNYNNTREEDSWGSSMSLRVVGSLN